jgi:hypothetical protein
MEIAHVWSWYVGNQSYTLVPGVRGDEGCGEGVGDGRCAWEAIYSTSLPRSKTSFVASTFWTSSSMQMVVSSLALAICDDREQGKMERRS